nr:4Fe-4S binding protein [uncultured Methanospirillum sp.]
MVVSFIPQQVGLAYALIAIPVIIYLYRSGRFTAPVQMILLVLSTLFGFLVFAPVAPYQFQQVLLGEVRQLGMPLSAVLFFLILFIAVTILAGRVYCSSVCPIGAIQELLSKAPVPKLSLPYKRAVLGVHLIIGGIFAGYALLLSTCLFKCMGIRSFFFLDLSSEWFWLFAVLMALGLFVYRPFCRFICPYGLILTAGSYLSLYRLSRTDACIECGKCEQVCPTQEAFRNSTKSECFLCGRCTTVCPVSGALVYANHRKSEEYR